MKATAKRIEKKLFAVSQDIKVGDDIYVNGKKETVKSLDLPVVILGEKHYAPIEACFKVLGELSPQAEWVKDGDIIEVDNLEVTYDSKVLIDRPYFAVKCPTCKQYH